MSTRGEEGAKALAVIKGQLSATETRLYEICMDFGETELKGSGRPAGAVNQIGTHVWALAMDLEVYREKIEVFTDLFRESFDLPPIRIRRDNFAHRRMLRDFMLKGSKNYSDVEKERVDEFIKELRVPD